MRQISLALLLALVVPALAGGAAQDTKLSLVAYSTPRELYDHQANEFVMSFVGPVNRLGEAFIRPLRRGEIVYVRPTRRTVFG